MRSTSASTPKIHIRKVVSSRQKRDFGDVQGSLITSEGYDSYTQPEKKENAQPARWCFNSLSMCFFFKWSLCASRSIVCTCAYLARNILPLSLQSPFPSLPVFFLFFFFFSFLPGNPLAQRTEWGTMGDYFWWIVGVFCLSNQFIWLFDYITWLFVKMTAAMGEGRCRYRGMCCYVVQYCTLGDSDLSYIRFLMFGGNSELLPPHSGVLWDVDVVINLLLEPYNNINFKLYIHILLRKLL